MRVTLDWDTTAEQQENLEAARRAFEDKPWELRRSSSGEGWHFIGYEATNDTMQGLREMMNLRELWGDDSKRVRLDQKRMNAGSPFLQVLYRRKYMDRIDYPEPGTGYSTGNVANVVEQNDAVKAVAESERILSDDGELDYQKAMKLTLEAKGWNASDLSDYLGTRDDPRVYGDESGGRSAGTIREYLRGDRAVKSDAVRRWTRRNSRIQGIGHFAEGKDAAADEVRYIDDGEQRRTLVEYIDVPWDWEIGEEDREYALLNTHTGSYNEEHGDQQLHHIHDDVTDHVMEALSPSNPETGQQLNLDAQNTHFSVDGWSRERDSINYEREFLDPGEDQVYIDNLPNGNVDNPGAYPLFEVILWDENMTDLIWHVIGVWTGSNVAGATILKDTKGWW